MIDTKTRSEMQPALFTLVLIPLVVLGIQISNHGHLLANTLGEVLLSSAAGAFGVIGQCLKFSRAKIDSAERWEALAAMAAIFIAMIYLIARATSL